LDKKNAKIYIHNTNQALRWIEKKMNILTLIRTRYEHLKNSKLSCESLRIKNSQKFRNLVKFIDRHSPYYRKIIKDYDIDPGTCSPEHFPVLSKQQVMENFDEIVTDKAITYEKIESFIRTSNNPLNLFKNKYYVLHTSGSSGKPGYFVYSKDDFSRGMAHGMRLVSFKLRGRRTRIAFLGTANGHFAGVTMVSMSKRSVSRLLFKTGIFEINRPIDSLLHDLNEFNPDILIGYATMLIILAEKKKEGLLRISPSIIESCGEPLFSTNKNILENTFKCAVLNVYAVTEHIYMGISKPEYNGMYLLEDDLIFELHEDHICITNLFNFTMPLIRYRMDDVLVPIEDLDKKLPFIKIREVIARSEFTPIFKNKYGDDDFISPFVFDPFSVNNLRAFQIKLIDKQSFIFKALPQSGLSDSQKHEMHEVIKSKLSRILSEKCMDNVTFEIQELEDLPINPITRKAALIVPPEGTY